MYNQDKYISEQVRQLNEIPEGIGFNSAATWNKLEDRLQQKTNDTKAWLQIAAVFILLAAGVIVFFLMGGSSQGRPAVSVTTIPANKQNAESFVRKSPQYTRTVVENIITTIPVRQTKQAVIATSPVLLQENNQLVTAPPGLSTASNEPQLTTPFLEQATVINTDPVVTPAVTATVKKPKLRIVHLNELYKTDPVEIARAETRKPQPEPEPEPEHVNPNPPKPFWKSKSIRTATSLTDNQ